VLCFCFVLFRIVYPKLSASLDCHFWIALWYSLTFSYRRLTFFPNCIWTPSFSAKHNNLASVVWHTSLMLFHFKTVSTNFPYPLYYCKNRWFQYNVCWKKTILDVYMYILNHVIGLYKRSVWNCLSEDKHSISIGILIPSTTKYINMCSILFIDPCYLTI
jgi:hypothetical protein